MKPFIPDRLPIPDIDWEGNAALVGQANRAISGYGGILHTLPNPTLMLSPLTAQEAMLSSKIEGTRATLSEVLQHDAGEPPDSPERKKDIEEIDNYRFALMNARYALNHRPFSLGLLLELHQRLLDSVRGANKNPGKFRVTPNWIGAPGSSMEEAYFVPPPPELVRDYMENFESYYLLDRPDPLVQAAILHAQFEIIHPFDDGNGRLGRMLIPLFFYEKKILFEPMFYLSGFFERNRDIYVERLRAIGNSTPAAWNAWIRFFMTAVIEQSETNTTTIKEIMKLYSALKDETISLTRSQYAVPVLDYIFSKPIFSPADLAKQPGMPTRAQLGHIFNRLKDAGVVTVYRQGAGRRAEKLAFPALINICEGRQALFDPRHEEKSAQSPSPPASPNQG